jgi:ATP-binding cassette subfamily B protein
MFRRYYYITKKYFSLGANSKKCLFHLFFSAILRSVSLLTLPFIAAIIVRHATDGNFDEALLWVAIFFGASMTYVLCHHYNYVAYTRNAIYIHNTLQKKIMDKATVLDENFTKDMSTSFIVNSAFSDVGKIMEVPDRLFDGVSYTISMIISVVVLFNVDVYIGLVALIFNAVAFWIFSHNVVRRDHYLTRQLKQQDKITGLLGQVMDGDKEIKAFNMIDDLNGYLEDYKKQWRSEYFKKRTYQDRLFVHTPAVLSVGKMLIYLILIILILNGRYDIATLVLVVGYYEDIEDRSCRLFEDLSAISHYSTQVDRVHKILNYQTKNMLEFGGNQQDDVRGEVKFVNVSFSYEKQTMLRNVSFDISPRSFTTIVGKSGNGKSTIFRLLLRLYRVNKGSILLDNVNIYDYSKEVYASNVSIVTQKPFIFDMSIRENLNLVDPNHEHQVAACKRVGIHDYIMNLKDGYNTKLIRDAETMSGGQRQLLAFARTLLSKAEVLLFDEVTATLDMNTSKQVFKIMQDLKKDHTVLVITHNPELMKISDDILVVNKGKIVGKGAHSVLIKKNKYYQVLHK